MEINDFKTVVVTGGAGFIGSNLVRKILNDTNLSVIVVDKLTYAGSLESLKDLQNNPRFFFEKVDICNPNEIKRIFSEHKPLAILNLAAESHVDRSIDGPSEFLQTNVFGTFNLLERAKEYFNQLSEQEKAIFRFLHVSTDEVFGSLEETGFFTEETSYKPNSPYSASKAASDHFVRAWLHTYGLPTIITNCSNNYGPYQFPEKLIPLSIFNAIKEKPISIYGDGKNVRDWLYVDDHCSGILQALTIGQIGESYNIGGNNEKTNLELIHQLCEYLDSKKPSSNLKSYKELITFVTDRPGHDRRYAIDSSKIQKEINWSPAETFETGIKKTIDWYLDNQDWCKSVMEEKYTGQRIGTGDKTKIGV